MDLKNFESTSILAIEAVYRHLWNFIPNKYKLPETDELITDLSPFYDPELTFDNRLHYKLSKVSYTNRAKPWFVITWNTEHGLIKSGLTQRRFQSAIVENKKLGKIRYKFINTELSINFGICCNTMQGLFELQENLILKKRDKITVNTKPHSIIGSFPVCLDVLDSTQNKLERDKGTLCYLFLECKIDYPIIGNVEQLYSGIIKEIHLHTKDMEGTTQIEDIIKEDDDACGCEEHTEE